MPCLACGIAWQDMGFEEVAAKNALEATNGRAQREQARGGGEESEKEGEVSNLAVRKHKATQTVGRM